MSSRPLLKPQQVLVAADVSIDATSIVTNINMISIFSYTVVFTGTPTGTFTVQVSNDYVPSPAGVLDAPTNAGHWIDLTLTTTLAPTGSAGSGFLDVHNTGAAYARLKYTHSSGAGTASAWIAGKCA